MELFMYIQIKTVSNEEKIWKFWSYPCSWIFYAFAYYLQPRKSFFLLQMQLHFSPTFIRYLELLQQGISELYATTGLIFLNK
jgi:hypothetical protein